MKFVGLEPAGIRLAELNDNSLPDCEEVWAAIPYAEHGNSEILIFDAARKYSKPIKFFGRMDGTCPIDPKVLEWFLKRQVSNADIECRLVPHWLHAKVIWWVGVGAYIGSANLTDRAWNQNHEAGVFLTQDELDAEGMSEKLDMFFDQIAEKSRPLDENYYKSQLELHGQRSKLANELYSLQAKFEGSDAALKDRSSPIFNSQKRKSFEAKEQKFITEWNETMAYLLPLSKRVASDEYRPSWMPENTPIGVQCDQFLHAYYYLKVSSRTEADAYLRHYEENKKNPEAAVRHSLEWWRDGDYPHEHELDMAAIYAPQFVQNFSREALLRLDQETFAQTMAHSHAFRMHSTRMSLDNLGFTKNPGTEEKILAHGRQLFSTYSKSGAKSAIEVFHYVIWGGGVVAERIWKGVHHPDYQLPDIGASTLGELVGWARPNEYPPRNQRTNKAIKALGRQIKVAL